MGVRYTQSVVENDANTSEAESPITLPHAPGLSAIERCSEPEASCVLRHRDQGHGLRSDIRAAHGRGWNWRRARVRGRAQ